MEKNEKFSWSKRMRSFRYALNGVYTLVRDEHNARIHLCAAVTAIVLGVWLRIRTWEWVAVVLCIALVLAAEAFNSAIEAVADRFGPERHPLIAKAKDIAAAGVLILAIGAAITGAVIFLPRILSL